jgi:hypothetical protein
MVEGFAATGGCRKTLVGDELPSGVDSAVRVGQSVAMARQSFDAMTAIVTGGASGIGRALGAALAVGLRRYPAIRRRHFLRTSSAALALFALAPAIGYGALARVDSDNKRDAFDDANEILVQLETRQVGTT